MAGSGSHLLVPLNKEEQEVVLATRGEASSLKELVRTEPPTITLAAGFKRMQAKLASMEVRKEDVFVITPPKCGTTWTQEIVWLVANKANTQEAREKDMFQRSPFIDFAMFIMTTQEEVDGFFQQLDTLPSPRIIKTHFPFELLPPHLLDTCKVVFVCRNVKDAAVSFFYHERLMKRHDLLDIPFERYAAELYRPGLVLLGSYFSMLESGWSRREHPNLLFLWFEGMKEDSLGTVRRIATHIGASLTEEQMEVIEEYTRFENMSKTCILNKPGPMFYEDRGQFMRKGKVGDWSNHFPASLAEEWDLWAKQELDRIGVEDKEVRGYFGLRDI